MTDNLQLDIVHDPTTEDRDFIHERIKQFNNAVSPAHKAARAPGVVKYFAIFVRDASGAIQGGLTAHMVWGWLYVDDFWLPETLRGHGWGTRLLAEAETIAQEHGCTRAHLQTFSFQARDFYARCGYRVVGTLDDYPPEHAFYWMRKDFAG